MHLSEESPDDVDEVEALFDLAFAPGRAALSSYRLRDGVAPEAPLCLIARDDYWVVVGAIRYWPIVIADPSAPGLAAERRSRPALLLGPVAVHPTRQGEGLGAVLIQTSLERAAAAGWERVLLIGDEPYYRRFGFSRALAEGVAFPPPTNPRRILAKELTPDAMADVRGEARRIDAADRGRAKGR